MMVSLMWFLVKGGQASLREENPDKGGGCEERGEELGSKVPARVQQYSASRSDRGKREEEGSPVTKK